MEPKLSPYKALVILEEVKELDDSIYQHSQDYMDALNVAIEALKVFGELPSDKTNGDVVMATFPDAKYVECRNTIAMHTEYFGITYFDKEWWSAQFKGIARTKSEVEHEEEREGQWQKHDNYFDCPFCGCLAPSTDTADALVWKLSNYCPDCKAKLGDGALVMQKHEVDLGPLMELAKLKDEMKELKAELKRLKDEEANKQ